MSYVFVWVRDNLGIPIMSETIRTMFSDIVKLRDLYQDQIFTYYDADTAETRKVELPPEFDRTLLNPVRDYVTETGGFSNTKAWETRTRFASSIPMWWVASAKPLPR